MKYLMLVCTEEFVDFSSPGFDPGPPDADPEPWAEEMDRRGIRIMGERVRPAADATTVRVRAGEVLTTDGPYAETKEQMAGFDILDCADLDEAIEVAAKHPMARYGMLELRPFWPFTE